MNLVEKTARHVGFALAVLFVMVIVVACWRPLSAGLDSAMGTLEFGAPPGMADFVLFLALCVCTLVLGYFCLEARFAFDRWSLRDKCRQDPEEIQSFLADLRSADRSRARKALQVLADFCDHPFGIVECWPFDRVGDGKRFETIVRLYEMKFAAAARKDWANLETDAVARLEEVVHAEDFVFPAGTADGGDDPVKLNLPPLSAWHFIQAMRGKVDATLGKVAAAINEVSTDEGVSASAAAVQASFVDLCREAVRTGAHLRLQSVAGGAAPVRGPEEVEETARRDVHAVLCRFARLYGESSPRAVFPDDLPQVRRLLADFWWAALDVGLQVAHRPGAKPGDVIERQDDVGGGANLAGKIDGFVDRVADHLKDAVLDLEIGDPPASRLEEAVPLPPLDTARFVAAARVKIDDVLKQLADAVNDERTAPDVARNADDVCYLFGELGGVMLDLALTMRIEAAARGTRDSRPRRVRCKRVSEIRLPHAPGSQGRWVEKYRDMRAREGAWPPA